MKLIATIICSFIFTCCGQTVPKEKSVTKNDIYKVILRAEISDAEKYPETDELYSTEIPGVIDTTIIEKLNEPLIALTALYSALGGTMCNGEHCALTTALGLGKQGSEKHKNNIKKYFPGDKVAETVLKQDCYLRPSGASTFSDFEFLTVTDKGDTIFVDYKLMHYNRGEIEWIEGPDIYLFHGNKFEKVKRNLWVFAEK